MKTLTLAGYEIKVLEPEELQKVISQLNDEFSKRMEEAQQIQVRYINNTESGDTVINRATNLEKYLSQIQLSEVIGTTMAVCDSIDELTEQMPDFFELPYINGKNLYLACERMRPFLTNMGDNIRDSPNLKTEYLFTDRLYDIVFDFLGRGIRLYDTFCEGKDPNLEIYKTKMKIDNASASLSRLYFLSLITPFVEGEPGKPKIVDLGHLLKQGIIIYHSLLSESVFHNKYELTLALFGLGDMMKLTEEGEKELQKKGLQCYEAAGTILGPDYPWVKQGIDWYHKRGIE